MEGSAVAGNGFDNFVMCGGLAPGGLTVVCSEKKESLFVNACLVEVESSKMENVIDDMVAEVEFENV